MAAQAASFTHTCFMITPYAGYVAVCEQLNRLTPGTHAKKSVLVNSGAEAVENAVKYARPGEAPMVMISGISREGHAEIVVRDHGIR